MMGSVCGFPRYPRRVERHLVIKDKKGRQQMRLCTRIPYPAYRRTSASRELLSACGPGSPFVRADGAPGNGMQIVSIRGPVLIGK